MGYQKNREKALDFAFEMIKKNWQAKNETWLRARYAQWCAMGLLGSGDKNKIDFAMKMLEECGEFPFPCHFTPSLCVQLLVKHEKVLSESVREKIMSYLDKNYDDVLGDYMGFVGVNDNFPCMSTYSALVGGEYMGNKKAVEIGKRRLIELDEMLTRRDMLSEYTSRCYTGMSIYHIASIATDVKDPDLKEVALRCEKKLWYDVAAHYFKPLNMMAGPYSRTYKYETLGEKMAPEQELLYLVLGLGELADFTDYGGVHDIEADARLCWYSSCDYHFPEEYLPLITDKKYPYQVDLTAEVAPHKYHNAADRMNSDRDNIEKSMKLDIIDEYPAFVSHNTTYMEKDYAVGTALKQFHSATGSEQYFVLYTKGGASRAVFSRYIINDKEVGKENYNEWLKCTDPEVPFDEGRKISIQDKSTSLVTYKPTYYCCDAISQMRMSVIFNLKGDRLDEVRIGAEQISSDEYTDKETQPVYIRDGNVYMAFLPLNVKDMGREYAMKFQYINGFAEISYVNYKGDTTSMRKNEMLLTTNGYVSVIREAEDFNSFDEFVSLYNDYVIEDKLIVCAHTRGAAERKVLFKNFESDFKMELSPISEGIRYAVANGKVII